MQTHIDTWKGNVVWVGEQKAKYLC